MPAFNQITSHLFKLDVPFAVPVGVFLVKHAEGWTVIDAGAPGFEKMICDAILAQTNGEKPKRLILTHGHLDHAAAAKKMRDDWGVLIAAGRVEIPYLLGSGRYNKIPPGNPLYNLIQLSPPALFGRNVQLPLDEGMQMDGLEIFHVPGHAPGLVALFHRADRALISGDTFMNLKDKLSDPYGAFTYDLALNHQSQAKLAQLDFDHLLVSHGPVIMNEGQKQVKALVEGRGKKKKS
jgi:glyoxylase-like metal-dependent hydrolase (beta-lactamase superfamily II)